MSSEELKPCSEPQAHPERCGCQPDTFQIARHSKRLVEQQRERIDALEAENARLNDLISAARRVTGAVIEERDAALAQLAAIQGGMGEAVGKVVAISGFRQAAVLLDAYQTASAGQSLVGSKLYATPPASPDVEGLVKVLEKIAEKCSDPDTTDALDTAISTWRQAQEGKP